MNIEKIKEMIKSKKGIAISSAVVALVTIGTITGVVIHNKSKDEVNNQIVETNKKKDNTEEKEVKNKLEELKKTDVSKLSEEEKKNVESKIADIEKLIESKEYAKAKTNIESLKSNINTKLEELVKKEETKEENKEEKTEENKEVASNTTSSNTSTSSNSESSSSLSQGTVQQQTAPQEQPSEPSYIPPVVEEQPVQPSPAPTPTPQPPVETPSYPSVGEVQQRLISYGESIGLIYDASLVSSGFELQGTDQMWDSQNGGSTDRWLIDGVKAQGYTRFAVYVQDLGNGFCSMGVYVSYDE